LAVSGDEPHAAAHKHKTLPKMLRRANVFPSIKLSLVKWSVVLATPQS
jgi:hypothetical protein